MRSRSARPTTLKAIIAYKFVKAPAVLVIAVLLTFYPRRSHAWALAAIGEISEWGAVALSVAHWLRMHLTATVQTEAAVLAWLDAISTFIEGMLLLSGRPWGEWIVVGSVSALIPFEVVALVEHPHIGRAAVLIINLGVAGYLAWHRATADGLASKRTTPSQPRSTRRALPAR